MNKKKRLIFKRSKDFWTGFLVSLWVISLILMFITDLSTTSISVIATGLIVTSIFLYYVNYTTKIINMVFKGLLWWKKPNSKVENYSIAMEYSTLSDIVESKKKLEEALELIKIANDDEKISEIINNVKNNKQNDTTIWKN